MASYPLSNGFTNAGSRFKAREVREMLVLEGRGVLRVASQKTLPMLVCRNIHYASGPSGEF